MDKPDTRKIKAYDKTKGICIICGKPTIKNDASSWSVEHYIPRAVYKWVDTPLLKQKLESMENLFITHRECNFKKDAVLPTVNTIKKTGVCQKIKEELLHMYQTIEPSIIKYQAIKQNVLSSQKEKCFFCNKKITLDNTTLRRKNSKLPRIETNAMGLCFTCSVRSGNIQYKHKMVATKCI